MTPLAEAVRTGQPVWALSAVETGRFRAAAQALSAGDAGWAAVPLAGRGGTMGAHLLGFDRPILLAAEEMRAVDENDGRVRKELVAVDQAGKRSPMALRPAAKPAAGRGLLRALLSG